MKALIAVLAVLAGIAASQARIITVDDNGPADFNSIQAAVDDANDGDTIMVAAGVYYEEVRVLRKQNISLIGAGADDTIVDGSAGSNSHVVSYNTASGEVSGFTLRNSGDEPGYLSGVFASHSTLKIENNVIRDNCRGIGISSNSDALVVGNEIVNNTSPYAAMKVSQSNAIIINNVIAQNSGDAIDCEHSSPSIINNTIVGNSWGIVTSPTAEQVITNNIISQNEYGIFTLGGEESAVPLLKISYNNLWANSEANYWEEYGVITPWGGWGVSRAFSPSPGTGERHQLPLFADAANGDYHLKSQAGRWNPELQSWVTDDVTSPCIDRGDPASDWTGELWPHGKRINMGAYGGTPQASMSPSQAGNIADLNNDGVVDHLDIELFSAQCPNQQVLLQEDVDRDGTVGFRDLAVLGQNWRWREW